MYKKERPLIVHILTTLSLCDVFAWRNNTAGFYDTKKKCFRKAQDQIKGPSDILGVLPDGKFLAIECKTKNDKLTHSQVEFLADIESKFGIGIVAKNIDDVLNRLKTEGYIEWDGAQITRLK